MEDRPPPPTLTSCLHPFPQLSTQRLACSCFLPGPAQMFLLLDTLPPGDSHAQLQCPRCSSGKATATWVSAAEGVSAGGPFLDS